MKWDSWGLDVASHFLHGLLSMESIDTRKTGIMDDSTDTHVPADRRSTTEWRIRQVIRIEAYLEGCSEHRVGRQLIDAVAGLFPAEAVA